MIVFGLARRVRRTALIALSAGLAFSALAISPAEASVSKHVTYLAGGHVASDAHYKPVALTLSGDSTLFIKDARWHGWGNAHASGSAQTGWNDCTPNCAQGTVSWYLAKLTLSKPKLVCGKHFFTRVTFHFTHKRPSGIKQNYQWDATPVC